MLRRVFIKSYRSCEDVTVDGFDELTLLVGRNGVGKSNLLKAIAWCARTATTSSPISLMERVQGSVSLEVEIGEHYFTYYLDTGFLEDGSKRSWGIREKLSIKTGEESVDVFLRDGANIKLHDSADLVVSPHLPAISAVHSLVPLHEHMDVILKLRAFLNKVRYYPLVEIENADENYANLFISEEQFAKWQSGQLAENSTREVLCKILDLYLNEHDTFKELLSLLGSRGIGIIDEIEVDEFYLPKNALDSVDSSRQQDSDQAKIHFMGFKSPMYPSKKGIRFDSLSFGTKRLIRFVTDYLYDNSSIYLLEQPEDGVHCGLLYKLFGLLESYSEGRQTIIASHSADLLNIASPSSIRMVDVVNGVTTVRGLTANEQDAAIEFKNKVGTLSEFIHSLQE